MLSEVPEAIRYLEQGHARGKVVINVEGDNKTSPVRADLAASSANTVGSDLVVLAVIAIVIRSSPAARRWSCCWRSEPAAFWRLARLFAGESGGELP